VGLAACDGAAKPVTARGGCSAPHRSAQALAEQEDGPGWGRADIERRGHSAGDTGRRRGDSPLDGHAPSRSRQRGAQVEALRINFPKGAIIGLSNRLLNKINQMNQSNSVPPREDHR
jgi:hypothetical protein